MRSVKAAVITKRSNIQLQTFPTPKLKRNELLVRVEMCGICASDIHIFNGDWGEPYPLIPGHEFIGVVEDAGENALTYHGVDIGDRVAVEMIIPCWNCHFCRSGLYNLCEMDRLEGRQYGCNISCERTPHLYGGWAEFLYVPEQARVHRIPEHVPLKRAVLTEPLAVAVRAVNLTPPNIGDDVVVVGAGPIGLMTVVAAKAAGANVILVGSREERLTLGKQLGADEVIDYRKENVFERIAQLTGDFGARLVFETAGTVDAQRESLQYASVGGTVNYIGLTGNKPVSIQTDKQMTFKELNLQTSFLSAWAYEGAISIIASGKYPIEKMITHEFSLDEVERAIDYSLHRTDHAIKVVLVP